jgi:cell division protein FtsW
MEFRLLSKAFKNGELIPDLYSNTRLGKNISPPLNWENPPEQTKGFAIIVEELGFLRAFLILLIFVFVAWRGIQIAKNAPDKFGKLLACGIVIWIVSQAFINVAAMLSLIPLTGIPLPFISYGGTSLVVSMAAVGILLNISKHSLVSKSKYQSNYQS